MSKTQRAAMTSMGKTQDQPQAQTPLWRMALHQPQIDADDLAHAVDDQLASGDLDYRTRLLIRRSAEALGNAWEDERYQHWLEDGHHRVELANILHEAFEEPGFDLLARAVVMSTKPETVKQFLRELGSLVREPTRLVIGGSIALILRGMLVRHTEDIDIVDEVPKPIRSLGKLLRDLTQQYRLAVTHFQSDYLPAGWKTRVTPFETMRNLEIVLVDPIDIFVGKLFSRRIKDRDDLRSLADELDRDVIVRRLADAGSILDNDRTREMAKQNWYVLFGEELPEVPD